MQNLYGLLKQNTLFESLGDDLLSDLAGSALKKTYQPDPENSGAYQTIERKYRQLRRRLYSNEE